MLAEQLAAHYMKECRAGCQNRWVVLGKSSESQLRRVNDSARTSNIRMPPPSAYEIPSHVV